MVEFEKVLYSPDLKMVLIFLVTKVFQKGAMFKRVTVFKLSNEMLRHAMVSDKPGGLSVQRPLPPGKSAVQLNSPFGNSCYRTETQADK